MASELNTSVDVFHFKQKDGQPLGQLWKQVWLMRLGLKMVLENDKFCPEMGLAFEEPGGTPPRSVIRS